MKEVLLLEQKFGKPQPFRIPDGYFERLEHNVLRKVSAMPQSIQKPVRRWLRPVTWAACIAVAVVSAVAYFSSISNKENTVANISVDDMSPSTYNDYMVDELSDFAMLDNDDFYSLIADE